MTGLPRPVPRRHEHEVMIVVCADEAPFQMVNPEQSQICFCFGYTEADIVEDYRSHGHSMIQRSIRDACRQGLSDCERLNPQGRCCLGDIAILLKNLSQAGDASQGCCSSAQGMSKEF